MSFPGRKFSSSDKTCSLRAVDSGEVNNRLIPSNSTPHYNKKFQGTEFKRG